MHSLPPQYPDCLEALDECHPRRRTTLPRTLQPLRPLPWWLSGVLVGVLVNWFMAGSGALSPQAVAAEPSGASLEFFEQKIRPVLVRHCQECHSSATGKRKGGLQLDTREGIRRGGESGPAVVPGDIEQSVLVAALRHESFEMPPTGKLPDDVINDFVRWIETGAVDPRDAKPTPPPVTGAVDVEAGRNFWSFQPLAPGPLPDVGDSDWPDSAIDHFILAGLRQRGLRPGADAEPAVLVRRLYFDLLGLPPSPQEIERFAADPSPPAYQRLVDRVLASPHFGERWGRHWLDVVRYADSVGGGRTRVLEDAWRYRDYVLDAFNQDRPYAEFVAEQVAGDLLPSATLEQEARRLTATALLVLGPTNYELQDKELLRMEVVDEQLDTLGRAFLGMTIGCARCHDHKFDPIPTADYYALAGILRSTKSLTPGNVSGFVQRPLPVPEAERQARQRYEQQLQPLQQQLAQAQQQLKTLQGPATVARDHIGLSDLPGWVVDETSAKLQGDWKSSSSVRPFVGDSYHYCGSGTATARFEVRLPKAGRYEVRISHTANPNRASNVPVTVYHAGGADRKRVNHRQAAPIDGLFVSLGKYAFDAGPAAVVVECEGLDGLAIADAVQWLPLEGDDKIAVAKKEPKASDGVQPAGTSDAKPGAEAEAEARAARERQVAEAEQQIQRLQARVKELQRTAPSAPPLVMSVQDESQVGDYHVCIRGNIRNPGDTVPRGFLRVISAGEPPQISPGESGRRELAEWLASPDNPLAARVLVNRVWLHLLGEGLVRTPDNFGSMGQRPSHPELLDYLAVRFLQQGGSIKQLVRRIVLSRVYRLSSDAYPPSQTLDPENRLLAHAHYRRHDAESLRDLILSVSGELDLAYGGSMIPAGTNSEFTFRFREGRRSVYLPVFRNRLHELLEVFDFADPNLVNGRRNTSTLPTQALFLMNSPFIMQQAQATADRLLRERESDAARLELLYQRALGREPTGLERQLTLDYLNRAVGDGSEVGAGRTSAQPASASAVISRAEQQRLAWSTVCQALFASLDFRYLK